VAVVSRDQRWNDTDREKVEINMSPLPLCPTKHSKWTSLESNLGCHDDRQVSNCLSHGTGMRTLFLSIPQHASSWKAPD